MAAKCRKPSLGMGCPFSCCGRMVGEKSRLSGTARLFQYGKARSEGINSAEESLFF